MNKQFNINLKYIKIKNHMFNDYHSLFHNSKKKIYIKYYENNSIILNFLKMF